MNMYNILGMFKNLIKSDAPVDTTKAKAAPIYESVEPRGSISEAVRSMESKFAAFKESTKPDFLDVDKDGDKAEPFKKAVKDKEEDGLSARLRKKGYSDKEQSDMGKLKEETLDELSKKTLGSYVNKSADAIAKNMAQAGMQVGKDDDKSRAHAVKAAHRLTGVQFATKRLAKEEKAVEEGSGAYTLDDPKHPRFKANYDYWIAKNPGKKLADFIAAMRKKEAALGEGKYDEPAAPDAEAIAKRKRLQAIKDRQEAGNDDYSSDTKSNVRTVKGTQYGGANQPDDPNEFEKGNFIQRKKSIDLGPIDDLDEVSPPGAKAERMVKHVKKGYADDGKLTKKEKGIAYATAWKAHNKGQVEEGTEFKDAGKIKNSAPNMKKAKPSMVKESRVMEETDYFYEKIAKALANKDCNLDTSSSDFYTVVRKEMIAQGIEPNRARNILLMDEDFIGDVATSYGHYCKEVAETRTDFFHNPNVPDHAQLPAPPEQVNVELDEIARLAGITDEGNAFTGKLAATPKGGEFELGGKKFKDTSVLEGLCNECGMYESKCACSTMEESSDEAKLDRYHELIKQGMDPDDAEVEVFNNNEDDDDILESFIGTHNTNNDTTEHFGKLRALHRTLSNAGYSTKSKDYRRSLAGKGSIVDAPSRGTVYTKNGSPSITIAHGYNAPGRTYVDVQKTDRFTKPISNLPKDIVADEMDEGNEFSGALAAAKANGAKEFEVDGKRYTVKEDININITANGEQDALNLIRKLSGMDEVTATPVSHEPHDLESAIAQGVIEPVEVEVDEERDIEYTNTPREETAPLSAAIPSGNDLNRAKKMYRKEYPGDNPMAVKEAALWKSYERMINTVKK